MDIELRPPAGFQTKALGAFTLADGYLMKPDPAGWYSIDKAHEYCLAGLLQGGWRLRSEIEKEADAAREAERLQADRERRIAALSADQIIAEVRDQKAQLEAREHQLFVRGDISSTVMEILRRRRADIIAELTKQHEAWRAV